MNKFKQKQVIWHVMSFFGLLVVFQLTTVLVSAKGAKNSYPFNDCAQKRAVLGRVVNDLNVTRRAVKNTENALAAKQRDLKAAIDYAGKLEIGRQAVGRDTVKRAMLDRLYSQADQSVRANQQQIRDIQKNLAKLRSEETYLVNQLHLIRDYVDQNCPAVPKPKPLPTIPNIAGNYNSSYGRTVITQEKRPEGVFITAIVYYDGRDNSPSSGTSRLTGFFDGKTWRFNWRNSYGNYGTGAMGYNADESLTGFWINNKNNTRGNWWLRPR